MGEHGHLGSARERSARRRDPRQRGLAVDAVARRGRAAPATSVRRRASRGPRPPRRPERRAQPRDASADHERLDVHVPVVGGRRSDVVGRKASHTGPSRRDEPLDERRARSPARSGGTPGPRLRRTRSAPPTPAENTPRGRPEQGRAAHRRRPPFATRALASVSPESPSKVDTVERERDRTRPVDAVTCRCVEPTAGRRRLLSPAWPRPRAGSRSTSCSSG